MSDLQMLVGQYLKVYGDLPVVVEIDDHGAVENLSPYSVFVDHDDKTKQPIAFVIGIKIAD